MPFPESDRVVPEGLELVSDRAVLGVQDGVRRRLVESSAVSVAAREEGGSGGRAGRGTVVVLEVNSPCLHGIHRGRGKAEVSRVEADVVDAPVICHEENDMRRLLFPGGARANSPALLRRFAVLAPALLPLLVWAQATPPGHHVLRVLWNPGIPKGRQRLLFLELGIHLGPQLRHFSGLLPGQVPLLQRVGAELKEGSLRDIRLAHLGVRRQAGAVAAH